MLSSFFKNKKVWQLLICLNIRTARASGVDESQSACLAPKRPWIPAPLGKVLRKKHDIMDVGFALLNIMRSSLMTIITSKLEENKED